MRKRSSSSVKIFYPRYEKGELVKLLKERIEILKNLLPLERVVLFGSYAKGNYDAFSNVDLLVIYSDPKIDEDFQIVKRMLKIRGLEPHVYTRSEYEAVKDVLERMTDGGIVLYEKGGSTPPHSS